MTADESESSEHAQDVEEKTIHDDPGSEKQTKDANNCHTESRLPFYSTGKIPFFFSYMHVVCYENPEIEITKPACKGN